MTRCGRCSRTKRERLGAVGGLERLVPAVLEQRHDEIAVRGVVVDDEDLAMARSATGSGQAGRARNPAGRSASISATKDSGSIGFER